LDELVFELGSDEIPEAKLMLATVYSASSSGVRLIFDGQDTASQKLYKRLNSASLSSGDRVLVAKASGTCVVLGKISYS
jgi:hypothetical protein